MTAFVVLLAPLLALLRYPSWRLLGVMTLIVTVLLGLWGLMTGAPGAAILFYGGVSVFVFVAVGALLILSRYAFNVISKATSAKS